MTKILRVEGNVVSLGMDDGSIRNVSLGDLNFFPHIGDEVDIYTSDDKVIISRKETSSGQSQDISFEVQGTTPLKARREANKVLYCVLALFFGMFGIHKFYAGKPGVGVAYLLFFWTWIPALLGFVDFLIGLLTKADERGNISF